MIVQSRDEKEAQLAAEVAELLRRAQEVDDEEDRRYGKDKRGDELPEELAFREGRLQKIGEAMAALEAEAQAAAEAEGKEHPGEPDDKAQRNFTDAESRIMPSITVAHTVKVPESVSCNDTAWHGPGGAVSSLTIGWSA